MEEVELIMRVLNAGSGAQGQAEGAAVRLETQACAGWMSGCGSGVLAVDGLDKPLREQGGTGMGTQSGTREWKHRHIQIEVRFSVDPHHLSSHNTPASGSAAKAQCNAIRARVLHREASGHLVTSVHAKTS